MQESPPTGQNLMRSSSRSTTDKNERTAPLLPNDLGLCTHVSVASTPDLHSLHASVQEEARLTSPNDDIAMVNGRLGSNDSVHMMEGGEVAMMNDDGTATSDEEHEQDEEEEEEEDDMDEFDQTDEEEEEEEAMEEEIGEQAIEFTVNRASVTRSGLIPCCVFVGRVTWGATDWEIYFGQKQLVRLHLHVLVYMLLRHRRWMRDIHLPWTIWREKRAERRIADVEVVQMYIRSLLHDPQLRNAEPLLSFLEVSPSRRMSRYGPSLKEGYVHMRMNGPFQLPLYKCFNPSIETLYRHLYRTWMRVAFVSAVITFIFPLVLILLTNLPRFFSPGKPILSADNTTFSREFNTQRVVLGLVSLASVVFVIVFVYKFFSHRLGVIRRWVVLKPTCFAAYRRRWDKEPSEVFLFDKTFTAAKGSYRQGVSWMPSGFVVGSNAGFVEIDTGHYYTRLTMFVSLAVVCYGIMHFSSRSYDLKPLPVDGGVPLSSIPVYKRNISEFENAYCGFYFKVPVNKNIHVSAGDRRDVVIYQLRVPSNESFATNLNYLWRGDQLVSGLGVLSNTIGGGSIVGVSKKMDLPTDRFLPTNLAVDVDGIGTLVLRGTHGTSVTQLSPATHFCKIPIQVALFGWSTIGYYILFLLTGGIISACSGLGLNYLIAYLGLWHAQVRRDQWFRCLLRLQKAKRQDTDNRYHSFAPERISTPCYEAHCADEAAACGARDVKAHSHTSMHSGVSIAPTPAASNHVSWHVDGEDTYEAMFKAIKNAKYEILIAGWWITPDLYLLRPGRKLAAYAPDDDKKSNESQLRSLLLARAQAGVKVYVLIYREVKLALSLNSNYTKRSLMIHPNIRVLRDPIFQIQSLGFWSHHEKIVCIDQSLAFVGGLDICFGRYDHSGHPLSDIGGDKIEDQTWPGKDYSNPITKDFIRVNKPFEDLIDRTAQPRMPWHDVHCSISGPAVQDVAYHFIQRWNFVCSKNDYQLRTGWCICLRSRRFKYLPKCIVPMDFNGWKLRYPSDAMMQDNVSNTMLVHDEPIGLDEPFQVVQYPSGPSPQILDPLLHSQTPIDMKSNHSIANRESITAPVHPNAKVCNIQVVRSVSLWSAGVHTEASIHDAYLDIISKARHYIYIENQFFISGLHGNGVVSNRILQALVDRIERAVKADEVFRVYVVMPLLPAFEGNIRSEELTNLHAVMHWQFASISRGKFSLFEALKKFTDRPEEYVAFFGLRKYGIMPNGCVSTEQIYIHSKLMIADDQYVIIGSANINDRSMCGDRDSEIALVIEDMHFQDGWMNEKRYRRGIVASALRLQLFREHLGLPDDDDTTTDPISDRIWRRIRSISQQNTKIFETVFDCAPSNKMRAFSAFKDCEITQIYENQRLNVLKGVGRHVWDKENLKEGDYAPWTDVNGVPIQMERINLDEYVIDRFKDKRRKQLFSMDSEGWLYARNFTVFQEVRTGKTDYRRREKLQHMLTDRFLGQVRRRRWVKKGSGLLPLHTLSRSSSCADDTDEENEHHRFMGSIWKRFHRSESNASHATSAYPGGGSQPNVSITSSVVMGDASYPNSPAISNFRRTTSSPSDSNYGRDSAPGMRSLRSSTLHTTNHNTTTPPVGANGSLLSNNIRESGSTTPSMSIRESSESVTKHLGSSLRKWYSYMDTPLDFGRRSRFTAEYFDRDPHPPHHHRSSDEFPLHGDEPLLESGRGSFNSVRSLHGDGTRGSHHGGGSSIDDDRDCQMGHVQTAATVPKEDESRARGQLSEIRGHLVDFPLDFLVEEILKPSIMPRDIHI